MSSSDSMKALKEFFAGTMGGIAQVLSGHPFDTIKVRMQTLDRPVGAMTLVKQTVHKEGAMALFKGMSSPLSGAALMCSVQFWTLGRARAAITGGDPNYEMSLSEHVAAGAVAGMGMATVSCPVDLLKTRLQVQYSASGEGARFRGPLDVAKHLVRHHGPKGLYIGMVPTVLREIPANMAYFGVYEATKKMMTPAGGRTEDLSLAHLFFAGGMGGFGYWGFTYPIDNIKSRIQAQPDQKRLYKGTMDCFRKVTRTEGWAGLMKGFTPCAARAWPANGATFAAYELTMRILSNSDDE